MKHKYIIFIHQIPKILFFISTAQLATKIRKRIHQYEAS